MSDQETPQPPASEERSSSSSASGANRPEQQQRERRAGIGGSERGERNDRSERGERSRRRHRRPHNAPPPQHNESSLNLEELRELMELFTEHGLTEFEFERDDFRVHLGRNPAPSAQPAQGHAMSAADSGMGAHAQQDASHARSAATSSSAPHAASAQGAGALPVPHHPGAQAEASAAADENLHIINSPIVGTFYRSPSPTAEPFVRIGSRVEHDTVVCIIEAMKLMNEIQSETSGEVVKIYVENGQPVEYGQPLFGIKK